MSIAEPQRASRRRAPQSPRDQAPDRPAFELVGTADEQAEQMYLLVAQRMRADARAAELAFRRRRSQSTMFFLIGLVLSVSVAGLGVSGLLLARTGEEAAAIMPSLFIYLLLIMSVVVALLSGLILRSQRRLERRLRDNRRDALIAAHSATLRAERRPRANDRPAGADS